jgi:hypothetical protein
MKHVRVMIEMILEVPDSTEIMDPEDEPYLQIDGRRYLPVHDWVTNAGGGMWETLDDEEYDRADELLRVAALASDIHEITQEEFRQAVNDDEDAVDKDEDEES